MIILCGLFTMDSHFHVRVVMSIIVNIKLLMIAAVIFQKGYNQGQQHCSTMVIELSVWIVSTVEENMILLRSDQARHETTGRKTLFTELAGHMIFTP